MCCCTGGFIATCNHSYKRFVFVVAYRVKRDSDLNARMNKVKSKEPVRVLFLIFMSCRRRESGRAFRRI